MHKDHITDVESDARPEPTGGLRSGFRGRLLAIVIALVALTVVVGAVGVVQIRQVSSRYDGVVQGDARLLKDVLQMRSALAAQVVGVRGFIISGGDGQALERYFAGSVAFEGELSEARTKVREHQDGVLLGRVERAYRRLKPIYRREIDFVQRRRIPEATGLVQGPGRAVENQAVAALDEFYRHKESDLRAGASAAGSLADRSILGLAILVSAALVLACVLALLVWRLASAMVRAAVVNRRLASMDALTALANHRTFHERLAEEFARARRHDRELSLALFDLDHFKNVNDVHGHPVGDEVLRETANRLRGQARRGDVVARVGGEEFAWLMPETPPSDAREVAERARALVSSTPYPGVGTMTASAGICDMQWADSPGDLYRLADGALYWAKGHGRDQSVVYAPDVVTDLSLEDHARRVERDRAVTAIVALARAVDARDPRTSRDSEQVAQLAGELAMAMGWSRDGVARLREAAKVHDVGKVGIPDAILFKTSELTDAEQNQVQAHAALSAQIVADALDSEQVAWVRGHHERFDGTGYPDGLAGNAIPQGARILAVADAWEAMTTQRAYGPVFDATDALEELRRHTGSRFCPDAVAALHQLQPSAGEVTSEVVGEPHRPISGEPIKGGEIPDLA